jgi:hypothetical protein
MKGLLSIVLLAAAGASLASVVIGTPEIPSMDPFCAS